MFLINRSDTAVFLCWIYLTKYKIRLLKFLLILNNINIYLKPNAYSLLKNAARTNI